MLSTSYFFFFFNDTATTEIYTLSLHDALPISGAPWRYVVAGSEIATRTWPTASSTLGCCECAAATHSRSEEHTSELQSRVDLVCRLLLEKKKEKKKYSKKCEI